MNKTLSNFILIIFISSLFINCANRGTPQGGPKDLDPPQITNAEPENYSIHFNGKEIKIYFNEYIKIKDLQKQLIISPPMNTQPEITPLGSASKYITIKIYDTLQPNTTYAFNFGNSITDNNEGNPYPYYKYVFSTGDYIDSLSVKGSILDAEKQAPDTFVSVMLYEVDSTFTDSIIYKKPPKYITNTLDSTTTFSIDNVKEGKYMLVALKDENNDNKFQQKTDKIAFHKSFINVPTDSLYTLKLFKEETNFNATRPQLVSGEKIAFGYEGSYQDMQITLKSDVPDGFSSRITKDIKTDTLYYWYQPKLEMDSLVFNVSKQSFDKDFVVRLKNNKRDTLVINADPKGNIGYDQDFKISGTTPFKSFDISKIAIIDKDSTEVVFTSTFDTITNSLALNFKKTEDNNYNISILPETFTDLFGDSNDSLNYKLNTPKKNAFGNVRIRLTNATYPIIVQLTNEKGEVKYEQYSTKQDVLDFLNVAPGNYLVKITFDKNGNGQYDSGNFLKKIQPEESIYFNLNKGDAIKADWDYEDAFDLIKR
ncbi:Ig-like domain-containing domain [Confluentibacter sediminis]|uniref:Ig-like domain-containing domain n=1 Tax=Confluentibacter sediminis TaxID=2219045 RepID=UPI000DAEFB53|nr:Ig-like domain-containing domain [Confluentibacter sediminis]